MAVKVWRSAAGAGSGGTLAEIRRWTGTATKVVETEIELIPGGMLDLTPDVHPTLFGDLTDRKRLVVLDPNVHERYPGILTLLDAYGLDCRVFVVPADVDLKASSAVLEMLQDEFEASGVERFIRRVIGFGGGELHDALGRVAAEWRRGAEYQYFGTTLVALIDAMFSLKVAVDMVRGDGATQRRRKNRLGAYHPAWKSVGDNVTFFPTLTRHDVLEGYAEILKWAIFGDGELFARLEAHGAQLCRENFAGADDLTQYCLGATIGGMKAELYDSGNGFEVNAARASYGGHGISPRLEPDLGHGQAVTLDILLTVMIALLRDVMKERDAARIVKTYRDAGFLLWHGVMEEPARIFDALRDTTAHRGGQQLWPSPTRIGQATFWNDVTHDEILRALDALHTWAHREPGSGNG